MKKIIPAIGAGAAALILSACGTPSGHPSLSPEELFEHQHGCHLDPNVGNEGGQCWKYMTEESSGIYVTNYDNKQTAMFVLSHDPSAIDGGMVTVLPS